jgi:hypothetical protein
MLAQQAAASFEQFSPVPADISAAATRYQIYREVEAEHLAKMAQHDLLVDWSDDVRRTVLTAGDHFRHARDARANFRAAVRRFVRALRSERATVSSVLVTVQSMLRTLVDTGALRGDDSFEAEVLTWAIEEYENAA